MIVVKCIDKIRGKSGKIVKYVLCDNTNNKVTLDAQTLKKFILDAHMDVVNLKLTSDGRLIDKTEEYKQYNNIEEKNNYLKLIANKTLEFIVPITKEFNDARQDNIEITNKEGKIAYLKCNDKTFSLIKEAILNEKLSAIRIVLYN